MSTRTAFNPSSGPPGRARRTASLVAASTLVVAVGLLFGLGSCTAVLGLDHYGNVAEEMCGLLDRCDAKSETPRCISRIADYLNEAAPEDQASWLETFTEFSCLESCGAGRHCLDIPPLCATSGSCERRQECCGFLEGNAACVKNSCCATRGSPCRSSDDCCAGAGQCTDGVCGGVACTEANRACQKDGNCCTKICKKDPGKPATADGVCAKTICEDDKGDCLADPDCCNLHCDLATKLCSTPPMCGQIDEACTVDPDCCPGSHCLIAPGALSGTCSSATCSEALVDCSTDTQCCTGRCDPIAFFCMPACLGTGTSCLDEGECCAGQCDNGFCAGSCSTGFCNDGADCCTGTCIAHACTAVCNPKAIHDPCTAGGPIVPTMENQACVDAVCNLDDYCCCGAWDEVCVAGALKFQAECLGLCQ